MWTHVASIEVIKSMGWRTQLPGPNGLWCIFLFFIVVDSFRMFMRRHGVLEDVMFITLFQKGWYYVFEKNGWYSYKMQSCTSFGSDQKHISMSNCKTGKLDPSTDLSRLPSCAEPKNTSDQATEHKHPNTILAIGTGTGGRGGDRGQAPRQHYVDCPYVATGA